MTPSEIIALLNAAEQLTAIGINAYNGIKATASATDLATIEAAIATNQAAANVSLTQAEADLDAAAKL